VTSPSGADLTVVIPTYNERDRLAELVNRLFDGAKTFGIDLEVVIVDDNSPDGTGQIADDLARAHRVQVVHRSGKLGLGTAVVAGFALATAETVGVMDADFSHPPALLPKMFAAFKRTGADVLVASRYVPGGSTPNWPFSRRFMSRSACLLARGLSPIRDAASGYFLIRREIARRVSIKAGGFKICLELIVRAWPTTLAELPYQFDDRELGESKMSKREAAGYLLQLKDLYLLRWSKFNRPKRTYKRLSVADVEQLEVRGDRSEFR
jgi:dolichol-phosphate mannosyltransferase